MGKSGKERKKRKLENQIRDIQQGHYSSARSAMRIHDPNLAAHPIQRQSAAVDVDDDGDHEDFEPDFVEDTFITPSDLDITIKTLAQLSASPENLKLPIFKPLRSIIHTLQQNAANIGINGGIVGFFTFRNILSISP